MGLDLLPLFQDRDRILIIDAVDFKMPPGHLGMLKGDAIRSALCSKLSVHHIGLADVLLAAKLTRQRPLDLCLIGMQPLSLGMGLELSDIATRQLERVLEMVKQKLNDWKVLVINSG